MGVPRASAAAYLKGQYGGSAKSLLSQAEVQDTDVSGGLKEPIDDALLLVDADYEQLATFEPTDVRLYFTALRYTTLTRILGGLNAKTHMNVQAGSGVGLQGNQLIEKVEFLLRQARDEAEALGIDISGSNGSGWGAMTADGGPLGFNLGFIETAS